VNYFFCLACGYRVFVRDRVAGSLILLAGCGFIVNVVNEILRTVGKPSFPAHAGVFSQVPWVCVIALLIARRHRQMRERLAADIIELNHAQEERRILESQLAQAQKTEAIGKLAAGVAHDFNNLLTVIYGYGEMLRSMVQPDKSMCTMVDGILDAGERAATLTRQLLTFSRLQVVEPRTLDLNAVVAESETMLRRLIGEDICLMTDLDLDLARTKADPGQIGQVIINLSVNARDAMPTGGKLTIETTNVDLDESVQGLHPQAAPGHYVMLTVTDTGSGMTPEVQARIFEPFYTTKGPGKGTGLGLATVRAIAEESAGFVSVNSEPGRGTTFKMYLPALGAIAPTERSAADLDAIPRGNETILLAEDEEPVRSLTCRILQQLGYTVVAASGGAEAIRLAEQHVGPIDLLVTDVVMPEINGRKLAERLTLMRPGLKVLFLSGYTDDAVVRHGVLQADVAFLQKPFAIEALARKVRQSLDLPVQKRKQTG
jgi:signal transduction histidine kinase/CheY-like chemotaxis protein